MMAAHQNAAKRLKALLRRTHFPVARLKQIRGPTPGGFINGEVGGGGAVVNPWASIIDGDPRAALIVLHWTLLDMSQLFSSNLLDRGYAGLQSLTDYKFVSKGLRMLREEFDCSPQLTVSRCFDFGSNTVAHDATSRGKCTRVAVDRTYRLESLVVRSGDLWGLV